jgi:hypothetical protein
VPRRSPGRVGACQRVGASATVLDMSYGYVPVSERPEWRIAHGLHPRHGESPLRYPHQLTPEEVEQAFASARQGCSVRALAKAFRLTRAAAHGLCQWARVLPLEADLPPHPECPPAFEDEPEAVASTPAPALGEVEAPTSKPTATSQASPATAQSPAPAPAPEAKRGWRRYL